MTLWTFESSHIAKLLLKNHVIKKYTQWNMLILAISLTVVAAVYTFHLWTFHPNKTVNKKKSRKLSNKTLKISCSCLISKQNAIANKNPNAADDDEQTFNYRWAKNFLNYWKALLLMIAMKMSFIMRSHCSPASNPGKQLCT